MSLRMINTKYITRLTRRVKTVSVARY